MIPCNSPRATDYTLLDMCTDGVDETKFKKTEW